ncbi:glutamate--cysteine ligase [Oceanicoccus sagamiensis]|uniref:Glutamate--cysteine ligase n=1 Tax=Oceanicoccus sagamiensis TaxID=716816 RepID=A0A1X9NB40_9GAMM|nr:glutamate--cysteine ligase [Oceanicoccus sagamiensis]ARN73652.1 glutamate--cysteine ligase [Oceanicoccus sagamiensis]
MPDQLTERLELIASNEHSPLLTGLQRGIEKESLRVCSSGKLAQTPHPQALGSALTHPHITTDFSEALLEFITPVFTDIDQSLECLDNVHRFTYPNLDNELLWTASMPCILEGDNNIPVAQYGSSNVATMKTAYRKGLGNRYGRLMQTISGIHYNFSLPDGLWESLQQQDYDKRPLQDYKTESYFKLIRNFRRFSWLLIYLYGASPAVCKSFLRGNGDHNLQTLDNGTVYAPYGTALRMGDLGYQSSAQENLKICYNSIDNYIDTLRQAITNTHPDYEKIGVKEDGDYRQLSTALLQIENEFYSTIRPKRVTQSGETPVGALKDRGVEYIEVRCIDVNPYLPLGIDADQIRFIDCFLLYCLFERSPLCDDDDRERINNNLKAVVNRGREPGLMLQTRTGDRSLNDWANKLLDGIDKIAEQLDAAHGGNNYQRVCQQQRGKIADASLTPSATILADMDKQKKPFFRFAMDLAEQHGKDFHNRPLTGEDLEYFLQKTALSKQQQAEIEAADSISFDQYLADYYQQYSNIK